MWPFINLVTALVVVALAAWVVNTQIRIKDNFRVIINVVLSLIVVGILLWLVNTYVPMAESIKAILNILVVLATIYYVLDSLGLWDRTVAMWHNLTTRAKRAVETPSEPSPTTNEDRRAA
jgi:hypothetical protein